MKSKQICSSNPPCLLFSLYFTNSLNLDKHCVKGREGREGRGEGRGGEGGGGGGGLLYCIIVSYHK